MLRTLGMRAPIVVAAGCLACGPSLEQSCVEVEEVARIEEDLGWICAATVAPDGTIVMAAGGMRPALIEVEAGGASWVRRELPLPEGPWERVLCGDVAVTPDGERWVTLALYPSEGSRRVIARAPLSGEASVATESDGVYGTLPPGQLAVDGEVLRVAGSIVVEEPSDPPNEPFGYVGEIERARNIVDHQHFMPGFFEAWGLVPRVSGRLVAFFREPSIDYSDGYVVSIDPEAVETEWVLHLRNETGESGPVASIVGIDDEDILVARHDYDRSELTRYDRFGESTWHHAQAWHGWQEQVVAHDVAVGVDVLTLTSVRAREDGTTTTFAELLDPDGASVCRDEVSLPFFDGTHRRAVLTAPDGRFLVIDEAPGDSPDPGLHITALGVQ